MLVMPVTCAFKVPPALKYSDDDLKSIICTMFLKKTMYRVRKKVNSLPQEKCNGVFSEDTLLSACISHFLLCFVKFLGGNLWVERCSPPSQWQHTGLRNKL